MKTNKRKPKYLITILIIIATLMVIACAIGLYAYTYVKSSYNGEARWVYIPENCDKEAFKDSLNNKFGDDVADKIITIYDFIDGDLAKSHGAYRITGGKTVLEIARIFANNYQTPIRARFNSARTMDDVARQISKPFAWNEEAFIIACDSILPISGFKTEEYPAAFFPDTYEFYWSDSPEDVINRLLEYRDKFWTQERIAQAEQMGLTPIEVSTLASIVEEETNKRDERPQVARLYLNRLDIDMPLQADPTIKFALGDFARQRILEADLNVNSPYNTYKNIGLPPGPIRIVEKATLEAVLNAPEHKYLYMCAKEDFSGYHNFATNYSDHLRNARRYQAALNRLNIKR